MDIPPTARWAANTVARPRSAAHTEDGEAGDRPPRVRRCRAGSRAAGAQLRRGHEQLVAERVAKSKGRITAKRLLPAARAEGYEGSARNLRRLVAARKALWRNDNHRGRQPAVWSPGEHLVIDWGVLGGLHVFCAVLAWCRVRFVRFADNERADTTLALLAECFEHLGGVPAVVLADRMGCLKGGVVANKVVPTAQYVRFAAHYPATTRSSACPGSPARTRRARSRARSAASADATSPPSRRRVPWRR